MPAVPFATVFDAARTRHGAGAIDAPALPAYLDTVERMLERRDATLRAAAAS